MGYRACTGIPDRRCLGIQAVPHVGTVLPVRRTRSSRQHSSYALRATRQQRRRLSPEHIKPVAARQISNVAEVRVLTSEHNQESPGAVHRKGRINVLNLGAMAISRVITRGGFLAAIVSRRDSLSPICSRRSAGWADRWRPDRRSRTGVD